MGVFTWVLCTVKRKQAGELVSEDTLGTHQFEIQPVSGAMIAASFGKIPFGSFLLVTRDGELPKFTVGGTEYTLQEGDIIEPESSSEFPRLKVIQVLPYETNHFEIIAEGLRNA